MKSVRKLSILFSIVFVLLAGNVPAQEKPETDRLSGLPEFISKVMEEWEVPGLAVTVVKDGEVIFSEGFGYRDVENELKVTPETLFAIGSSSKAFTVMAMGILVDEGKLDWDKPVIDYLEDFRLYDEYAAAHMTPRDLVCHRSGLPRHDISWYGASASREELYKRLQYLEPTEELRTVWQYNNFMFMTAGVLIERITGGTWEEFVRERILKPLGMNGSNFSVEDSEKAENAALPYSERDKKTEKAPYRNIDAIGPAGSINSSVAEMSNWLLLHLNKGKVGEKQLVTEVNLTRMHTPQMAITAPAQYAETPIMVYGLGWFIQPYRGHHTIQHGGGIDGFITLVSFMPFDNVGVVVLTNKSPNPLPTLLTYNIYDRLLGLEEVDWNTRFKEQRDKAQKAADEAKKEKDAKRKEGTSPSLPLEEYVGSYEHPGYGVVKVALEVGNLTATYNNTTSGLEHFHYDVFRPTDEQLENTKIRFNLDINGEIESVSIPFQAGVDDIVFEKMPDESLVKSDLLEKFAGEYEIMGVVAKFELRGDGTLTLTVPGQPMYELAPYKETEFKLKGIEGYSVEFRMDDEGNVTEAVFHQPNGAFPAKRKN